MVPKPQQNGFFPRFEEGWFTMNKFIALLVALTMALMVTGYVLSATYVLIALSIIIPVWALTQHKFDPKHVYRTGLHPIFKYPYHDPKTGNTVEDPGSEIDP